MKKFLIGMLIAFGIESTAWAASVTVNWTAGANATSHRVERKVDAAPYASLTTVPMPTAQYMDTTVAVGSAYCYRVVAIGTLGEAVPSAECCAALMPTGTASDVSCTINP